MQRTNIPWLTHVWNPMTGCSPVGKGCRCCWAARFAKRLRGRSGYPSKHPFDVTLHKERLDEPKRLRKHAEIGVCLMGDLFHADVPNSFIDSVHDVAELCLYHKFCFLTKRPERMISYLMTRYGGSIPIHFRFGISIEDQESAIERLTHLASWQKLVRPISQTSPFYISAEPLLGLIDLSFLMDGRYDGGKLIERVIFGPETGPGAIHNPMYLQWAAHLIVTCHDVLAIPVYEKARPAGPLLREPL